MPNHRDCNKGISKDPSHRPALKTELSEPRPMVEFGKEHKAAFTNKAGLDLVLEFGLSNGRSCELSKIGKRGVTQQAPELLTCCVEALKSCGRQSARPQT